MSKANTYAFETVNMDTCEISVSGHYAGRSVDLDVCCGDLSRTFDEIDGGSVEDIFAWLMDEGVEFDSKRSLWFNAHYVTSVMLDGDVTEGELLDEAASMSDGELDNWFDSWF